MSLRNVPASEPLHSSVRVHAANPQRKMMRVIVSYVSHDGPEKFLVAGIAARDGQ